MRNFPQALVAILFCFSPISFAASPPPTDSSDAAYEVSSTAATQTTSTGKLTLSPTPLSFSNTVVGTSAYQHVTVLASNGSVIIASKQLNNSEFSVSGLFLPLTLASGHSIQITIRFKPQSSGSTSGKLSFLTGAGTLLVADQLSGTGVAAIAHKVALSWTSDASAVIGYNVYRGAQNGGPYSRMNSALEASTNFTDATVKSGGTYYYTATAVNAKGQESGYSVPIKVAVPLP